MTRICAPLCASARRMLAVHGLSGAPSAMRLARLAASTTPTLRRLASSAPSSTTADRIKALGADAAKPTLDIDPFAKSQRLARPIAPHLLIYQPQLTWVMSGSFRVLAAAITAGFYGIAMTYAIVPVSSAALVASIHAFPGALIFLAKLAVATPFTFHFFNGIRHLMWDTGSFLSLKGVYNTGYAVLGLTAISSIILAFV